MRMQDWEKKIQKHRKNKKNRITFWFLDEALTALLMFSSFILYF